MQLDDLLRLLRARWYVIVAVTGIFLALTWVLVPDRLPSAGGSSFRATATLVAESGASAKSTTNQLSTYAVIATQGRVPAAVAEQAGVSTADLLAQVEVTPSVATNSLSVVATERTAGAAMRLADLLAKELVVALGEQEAAQRSVRRASLVAQVEDLAAEAGRLAARPSTDLSARAALDATNRQLNTQRAKVTELDGAAPTEQLRPLGPASIRRIEEVQVADKLLALPVRSLFALLLGLGGSIGVLLLADRFDVRLHTKEAVEVAFGFPVLAEVPVLPRKLRSRLVVAEAPETAFAEAHRILRTSVEVAKLAIGATDEIERKRPRLILVTSADPGEGKTTTAANLAASFAEAGRSTLLVGADLRHSDLHEIVRGPLRAQVVVIGPASPGSRSTQVRVGPTTMGQLRTATLEPPVGRPPVVLPLLANWLVGLADEVDAIVVDTPPLLVCNDASELIPFADAVVVVCRSGGTTADAAERCAEVLARLQAKVIGVVMVGAALRAPVRKVYGYGSPGHAAPINRTPPAEADDLHPAPAPAPAPTEAAPAPVEVEAAPVEGAVAPVQASGARDPAPPATAPEPRLEHLSDQSSAEPEAATAPRGS